MLQFVLKGIWGFTYIFAAESQIQWESWIFLNGIKSEKINHMKDAENIDFA